MRISYGHPAIQVFKPPLERSRAALATRSHDPGQSLGVANLILAWWDADDLGDTDLTDIFAVDQVIG